MPFRIVPNRRMWLVIDTETHSVRGRHATRQQAVSQRRILQTLQRRRDKKK